MGDNQLRIIAEGYQKYLVRHFQRCKKHIVRDVLISEYHLRQPVDTSRIGLVIIITANLIITPYKAIFLSLT